MAIRKYHRLTFEERKKAEKLYKNGCSQAEVANQLGVARSTMYREYRRGINSNTQNYEAELGQKAINMP